MSKYFIAVYTNQVKSYCDEEFFKRVDELRGKHYLGVVDNSKGLEYFKRLTRLTTGNIYKVNVKREPVRTLFLRNVAESVSALRQDFLDRDEDYFLIIESDVIPPVDLLKQLDYSIERLEATIAWDDPGKGERNPYKPWGILGGLYYKGFHDYEKTDLQPTHHVLSGCTLYKRELLEKYPFRWSEDNLGAFSDAWISYDAGQEYSLWNDHDIRCEHLHATDGTRQVGVL